MRSVFIKSSNVHLNVDLSHRWGFKSALEPYYAVGNDYCKCDKKNDYCFIKLNNTKTAV